MNRTIAILTFAAAVTSTASAPLLSYAAGDVAAAFAGAADSRLEKYIVTDAEYNAYLGWVEANGLDHETVTNSARGWFSHAVGASNLVERAFVDDDLKIVSLDVSDGEFTFEVDVKDVTLGASATEKSLATVFEVLGSPSLSEDSFVTNSVHARLGVSANGRLLVHASSTAPYEKFFVRVRMCPDDGIAEPVITCDGKYVEINCDNPAADIFYRIGSSGQFSQYEAPFEINATVTVQAYSAYKGQTGATVSTTCEYVPHDYSGDYLTFRVLTPGTIGWKSFGSLAKTIEYSIDDGAWTSITSTSGGATISVAKGDLVRFRGSNTAYATSKSAYSGFEGGTATYDIEGNIMSLLHGDNFAESTTLPDSNYIFCSLFKKAPVISAENLILPATTLKNYCYRALFSWCTTLTKAPELPATTLATGCYWYMFEQCAITEAPALNATTLVDECYGHMFTECGLLNTVTCLASSGFGTSKCLEEWVKNVAGAGTFVKSSNAADWTTGVNGIPSGWIECEDVLLLPPEVSFDGETIELECPTAGAEIYYRIGQASSFTKYTAPFEINATVTVQAYSTIDGKLSETVSQTCTYVPVVLAAPTISCAGNLVTIACTTPKSAIHYRLGEQGEFSLYGQPIEIEADTVVEAYSTYKGQTSTTVSTTCEYVQFHDYGADYLTFRVLTPGSICWKANGNLTKTIEYSIDKGAWTSITSTSEGATIPVARGNLVRFRGSNTAYATSKSAYSGFEGGTATYDIEGNIMSLLHGDNFAESTTLPDSNYIFCSLFKKAPVISAENLILPATTLKNYCYRALFSWCTTLTKAPELPATTLATGCYWYMFEQCAITEAPALNATTLVDECYGHMFTECGLLNTVTCLASSGFGTSKCLEEWVKNVAGAGTFVKSSNAADWTTGVNGIPSGWIECEDVLLLPPEVSFDGETIELECPTAGAEIYYRIGQASSFTKYTAPFEINATVTVQAYSTIDGKLSETVSQTCTYVPVVLAAPTISCAGNLVTIACTTPKSAIHYRLGEQGEFSLYGQPIEIEADTVVEAYSTYKGQTSTTVSTTCEYVQSHDYGADYLTFRVLTPGTISWKSFGSLVKTIEYSIDNGAWTSITSTSEGATIPVEKGDLVRFRGNNTVYATSKSAYSGFEGGTATYDIEGNIMSLLYGDNFSESTTLPNGNYIFCSLFKKAPVISAENLILPATTLKNYCYRALFSLCTTLTKAPELPATTLA